MSAKVRAAFARLRRTNTQQRDDAINELEARAELNDKAGAVLEFVGAPRLGALFRNNATDLRVLAAHMRADEQHGGQS